MDLDQTQRAKQNRIAQWAFDTKPVLGRFHLWLEDVEIEWIRGETKQEMEFVSEISFMDGRMERLMAVTAAVTALGTKLYGRFGEGAGDDRKHLNRVKKDADAISAYAMSEGLWFASRQLPENHAIMVSMGEGLMPKSGETREMGSNPQLGFGRIYARPQVAQWLEQRVLKLLNEDDYGFKDFYSEVKAGGITIWGAAIDTLENTSRFAKGMETGPMTVLHLFDQPLCIARPYEGYFGTLSIPQDVVRTAAENAVLIDFRTPRAKIMQAIEDTYPGIRPADIHVWTLQGEGRVGRIGELWKEWSDLGVHLVEDGWQMPSGVGAFTESGTYAPNYNVRSWKDEDGRVQVFIVDGYSASAEAVQAASLATSFDMDASMVIFTSRFELPFRREQEVMSLDPESPEFGEELEALFEKPLDEAKLLEYKEMVRDARDAGLPVSKRVVRADDFFPEKNWQVAAFAGYMCPDPYSRAAGVEQITTNIFRTTVRLATPRGDKRVIFTLRLMEIPRVERLVFNPLLIRFIYGEDFRTRPVKISDSGRIRNELQTLCSEALEYTGQQRIRVHFDRILPEVISKDGQRVLVEVLQWYQENHPIWFNWLDIVVD